MNIDAHIHITPPELIRDYKKIGEKEPYFKLLSETPHNKFATADEVVGHLKENQFDKGIVFGFAFQDMGLCRYVNDYTMEAVKTYSDSLIGFLTVPANHRDMAKEIERGYQGGLRGIGELFPEGQGLDLASLHTTDLKDCCLQYRLPLLIHANEPVGHYYAGKTKVSLEEMESFVKHHQGIPIILAHCGGGILFYELMKEVRSNFTQVYYDTAAALFLYDEKLYPVIREIGILDKLLFGSDYPLLPISRYKESFCLLSEEETAKVMGGNAQRLLESLK